MLDIRTAGTTELDYPDVAASEISEALRADSLNGDCLGFVTCSGDFIATGVLEAVCSRLPFPVMGIQTTDSTVDEGEGGAQLSLMVVGGDDVSFTRAVSGPLDDDPVTGLADMCTQGMVDGRQPVMAFLFAPMVECINDENIVAVVDEATGGIPLFGTLSVDYLDGTYLDNQVIFDGRAHGGRACAAFVHGPVEPTYVMAALPKNRILRQKAIITKSSNHILIEVNNIPVMQYLDSLGLVRDGKIPGIHSIPFIVDDASAARPESRSVLSVTPEGHVICGGEMREGMVLSLGAQDTDSVLETAGRVVGAVEAHPNPSAVMLFSCHSRSLALGLDVTAELRYVRERLAGETPLLMAYSGGEICPVAAEDGVLRNMSHSDTLVACIL